MLVPAEKVEARIGATGQPVYSNLHPWLAVDDTRPKKSGLRMAVEGRLRWLGVY